MKKMRQEHNRRSKPRCSEFPVLSLIFGELLLYLADASPSSTKPNRILVARIMNGALQVCSGDLKRLDLPLVSIPTLARRSRADQSEFEVGKDGACLYWPKFELRLGWEQLQQIANRSPEWAYPVPTATVEMIAAATVRGFKVVKELQKAEGGAWSGAELRKRFGLSSADLRSRRKEQRIIHWQGRQRTIFYPKWQFTPTGGLLSGVEELLQIFHSDDQWRVMRYFLSPRNQLDGYRPLDLLRAGKVKKVLAHASSHAAENTW